MTKPTVSRPYMPAYGIAQSEEGMLSWSWAQERLEANRNFWIGTVSPDGRPHSTAVWGVWLDGSFYFSMDPTSFKARNLAENPHVVITTESALECVIVEGVFEGMLDKSARYTGKRCVPREVRPSGFRLLFGAPDRGIRLHRGGGAVRIGSDPLAV